MNVWQAKAFIYDFLRKPWPFNRILATEYKINSMMLEMVPGETGRALDIGCGVGYSTTLLNTFESYAIDISFNMAKRAASKTKNVIVADAHRLAFRERSFDIVSCIGLSEYLSLLWHLRDSIAAVLKPKGFLLITSSPKNLYGYARIIGGAKLFLRHNSDVKNCFEASGFKLVEQHHIFSMDTFLFQKTAGLQCG